MHRSNDTSTRSNQTLQFPGIKIRIAIHGISENHLGTLTQECQRRGNEGIGRYDDLISRFQIAEHGAHLQGIRARGGEQALLETITFLEIVLTLLSKITVTRQFASKDCLIHVVSFLTREVRFIKWNHCHDF